MRMQNEIKNVSTRGEHGLTSASLRTGTVFSPPEVETAAEVRAIEPRSRSKTLFVTDVADRVFGRPTR